MIRTARKSNAGGRGASDRGDTPESATGAPHTRVARQVPSLTLVEDIASGELSGEKPALVPPGEYQLRLTHWETGIVWGRSQKVILHFLVCDVGIHFGTKLARYYNVEKIVGKPGRFGRFKVRWRHDLVRDYCTLFPTPQRLDRIDLDRLAHTILAARVETVTTTARQKTLPPALQYSVVRELLRIEAGGG